MRAFIFFIVLSIQFSCNSKEDRNEGVLRKLNYELEHIGLKPKNDSTNLARFTVAFLEKNKSKMQQNKILKKEALDEYKKYFLSTLPKGLLDDLPVSLLSLEKERDKYLATFSGNVKGKDSVYTVHFYTKAYIADSLIQSLKENNEYFVIGDYKEDKFSFWNVEAYESTGYVNIEAGSYVVKIKSITTSTIDK